MAYIASISYGKDSMAMLEAIRLLGLPLDRIVTVSEWATDEMRAVLPEVVAFEQRSDAWILDRYGIEVEHVRSPHTFESLFYSPMTRHSIRSGQIRGWPFQRGCWVNSFLKFEPFRKAIRPDDVSYIGIAANETPRIEHHALRENVRMPLVEIGWDEEKCLQYGKDCGMLSPTYTTFARDGCWFCMNQHVDRLRWLRKEHPDLWAMMLKWDAYSPCKFKAHYTIAMLEKRFAAEDAGLVPIGSGFKWNMVENL